VRIKQLGVIKRTPFEKFSKNAKVLGNAALVGHQESRDSEDKVRGEERERGKRNILDQQGAHAERKENCASTDPLKLRKKKHAMPGKGSR